MKQALVQLHKSYWVFIEPCVHALRRRAEGGARGAKEKTLNALRSPRSGREAIQRLFPRMSCEAALGSFFVLWCASMFWLQSTHAQLHESFVIVGARVVDGTGAPARTASVRIRDGMIVEVGVLEPAVGEQVVDAGGLVLTPGFIDTHSHHDRGLIEHPEAMAVVSQGITTIVAGQDGGSRFPLADFFNQLEEGPAAVNVASYVGHGTLRRRVMGDDFRRTATEAEIEAMRALLRDELAAGDDGVDARLHRHPQPSRPGSHRAP